MSKAKLLLDTHVWVWVGLGGPKLPAKLYQDINAAAQNGNLYISAISPWEISMLERKGKIQLGMPCLKWINSSLKKMRMQVLPLSPEISVESCNLPDNFRQDPADRMIVATARIENLVLVTHDDQILKYGKKNYVHAIKA